MSRPPDLEALYRDHAPALFRFLIRLTSSEAETKDILQEIFMRLARAEGLPDNLAAPRSWLFRLAHRLAIDRHRREETRRHYHYRAGEEMPATTPSSPNESDTAWREAILRAALEELAPDQRAVVLLKVWEGLTFAEIAGVMEISANTAASRYRYALDKLHTGLRPLYRELL